MCRGTARAPETGAGPGPHLTEVSRAFAHAGNIEIAFSGAGDREIIAFTAGNKR